MDHRSQSLTADLHSLVSNIAETIAAAVEGRMRQREQTQRQVAAPARRLLTVEQASECLSISRTTAYALLRDGELESVTVGNLRRVPTDAVDDFVRRLRSKE